MHDSSKLVSAVELVLEHTEGGEGWGKEDAVALLRVGERIGDCGWEVVKNRRLGEFGADTLGAAPGEAGRMPRTLGASELVGRSARMIWSAEGEPCAVASTAPNNTGMAKTEARSRVRMVSRPLNAIGATISQHRPR